MISVWEIRQDFKGSESGHFNVDAVTGGFNFQNDCTGGNIVAKAIISNKDG